MYINLNTTITNRGPGDLTRLYCNTPRGEDGLAGHLDVGLLCRWFSKSQRILYLNIQTNSKFGLDWSNGYCDKYFQHLRKLILTPCRSNR